jgi:tRNA A37 methylthiotransferase MiaB
MTGYAGETENEFRQSLDFVIANKKIIPKIEQINPFTYYEGTAAAVNADYRLNKQAVEHMHILTAAVKSYGFKYTKAYIGNLIEQ